MYKVIVNYHKKPGKTQEILFDSLEELKEYISALQTYELKNKDHYVKYNKEVLDFFKKNYNEKFFEVDSSLKLIKLKVLPSGIKRTKFYTQKKPNFNKTLNNALDRIDRDLKQELPKINFKHELLKGNFTDDRHHFLTIRLKDLERMDEERKKNSRCVIKFDKVLWTFEVTEFKTTRLKTVFDVIKRVFDKNTAPTRNYRRRKYGNNSE